MKLGAGYAIQTPTSVAATQVLHLLLLLLRGPEQGAGAGVEPHQSEVDVPVLNTKLTPAPGSSLSLRADLPSLLGK